MSTEGFNPLYSFTEKSSNYSLFFSLSLWERVGVRASERELG